VIGFAQRKPYWRGYDVSPINFAYSFTYKDFDDKEEGLRRRRHPRDNLRDLKIEALEVDGNLNLENYLDGVHVLETIFELKEYNIEKSSKLAILKLKRYSSPWYKHLKKSRATEAKSKIKT